MILYSFAIYLYVFLIRLAALFLPKAKEWVKGRKDWVPKLRDSIYERKEGQKTYWMHCASLGEYEQGLPLLEKIKSEFPEVFVVLSFFSPSGYNQVVNSAPVDAVIYLPADTPANAKTFIYILKPDLAIFIKYEFWLHILNQLYGLSIPAILVAGTFRKDQIFFKKYGGIFRKALGHFKLISLQDKASFVLLQSIGIKTAYVWGDPRYDRVWAIAASRPEMHVVRTKCMQSGIMIAGSTWSSDLPHIKEAFYRLSDHYSLIIAPHEVNKRSVEKIQAVFPEARLWSQVADMEDLTCSVLVIDSIGMLSRLYAIADFAYVGGGFHADGIHNILEPAVFHIPVFFGPNYTSFSEARTMVAEDLAFSVNNGTEIVDKVSDLQLNPDKMRLLREDLQHHFHMHTGSTDRVLKWIQDLDN